MSGLVIDTSVWISFFQGETLLSLEEALKDGHVILSPIVYSELMSGEISGSSEKSLLEFLEELDLHPTPPSHWLAVGRLRRFCGSKGIKISVPDAHIAQCALDLNASLYSFDKVFQKISRLTSLKIFVSF